MRKSTPAKGIGGPRRLAKEVINIRPSAGVVARELHLEQCQIVAHSAPRGFTEVERVTLGRCKVLGRAAERVMLREATIDRVTNESLFFVRNCLFDRVTLRGTLTRWIVEDDYAALAADDLERALDFYDGVEWALDLREAKLGSFELRDLPAEKILRDPARHFVLRRDRPMSKTTATAPKKRASKERAPKAPDPAKPAPREQVPRKQASQNTIRRGEELADLRLEEGATVRGQSLFDCSRTRCRGGGSFGTLPTITRVRAERSKVGPSCYLHSTKLRNIVVDTLDTAEPVTLEYCLFDRVELRGDLGSLRILADSPNSLPEKERKVRASLYDKVEWALDIRGARLREAIIRGVPVAKIRRDPERHAILYKDRVRRNRAWRKLPAPVVRRLDFWLSLHGEEELLVASDYAPYFAAQLELHRVLRDAGFAD